MTTLRRPFYLLFILFLITLTITACYGGDDLDWEGEEGYLEPADGQADRSQEQATLTIVQPPIEVQHSGQGSFTAVTEQTSIGEGDVVRTGPAGVAIITFAKGTQTYLYPGSELTINELVKSDTGNLLIWLEQTTGLSFNSINGDNTDAHDIDTPYGVVSVRRTDESGQSHSGNLHLMSQRFDLAGSTVFLTLNYLRLDTISGAPGMSVDVIKGAVDVNPNSDKGCDPACPDEILPVDAGQSANLDDQGEISYEDELDLICEGDVCIHPDIEEWIEDGTLLPPEDGEHPSYLPYEDEECDPDTEDCDDLPVDEECNPDTEDCDDLPVDEECNPDTEDCDDLPVDEECDPDTEECGDLPVDEECDPDTEDCGDLPVDEECDPETEDCGDISDDEYSDYPI